jgi:hypothetical protein
MDKNTYQEILFELENDKESYEQQCVEIETQFNKAKKLLSETETAISVIRSKIEKMQSEVKLPEYQNTYENKLEIVNFNPEVISFVDVGERILVAAGKAMHVSEIVEESNRLGKFTEKRKMADILRTDSKKRFINLGNNWWDLRSRYEQSQGEQD